MKHRTWCAACHKRHSIHARMHCQEKTKCYGGGIHCALEGIGVAFLERMRAEAAKVAA